MAKEPKPPRVERADESPDPQTLTTSHYREWIIGRMSIEACTADNPATRVRALELLGKAAGVFDLEEEGEKPRRMDDETLVDRLAAFLGIDPTRLADLLKPKG